MNSPTIKLTIGKRLLAIEGLTERSFRAKTSSWATVVAGLSWLSSFVRTPSSANAAVNLDEDPEKEIATEETENGWYKAIDSLARVIAREQETLAKFEQDIYAYLVIPMRTTDGGRHLASLQHRQKPFHEEEDCENLEGALQTKLEQFCHASFENGFAWLDEDKVVQVQRKMIEDGLINPETLAESVPNCVEFSQCQKLLGMLMCNPDFVSIASTPFTVHENPAGLTEDERVVVAKERVVTRVFQQKLKALAARVQNFHQKPIPDHIRDSLVSEFIAVAALIPTFIDARFDFLGFLRTRTSTAIPAAPRLRRATKPEDVGDMV